MPITDGFWNLVGWLDPFAKPGNMLTLRDLQRYPIWEYALDSESLPWRDETWMRPLKRSTVPWEEQGLTVAATLKVASGKMYPGTVEVSTMGHVLDVPRGHMTIAASWYFIPNRGQWREDETRAELLDALRDYGPVFPIEWTLKVPVDGESGFRSGLFTV